MSTQTNRNSVLPFKMIAERLIDSDQFIYDAKQILGIKPENFDRLCTEMADVAPFLDKSKLKEIATSSLGDHEESLEIVNTIWQLSSWLRTREESPEECMSLLRDAILNKMEDPEDQSERKTIADRLKKLIIAPVGFDRIFKARRLAESSGIELDDIGIICDIRPVFESDRINIEGAVVVTTLRIELDNNGVSSCFDVRMTEEQLEDLAEKVKFAGLKLNAIKRLLSEKEIELAVVPGALINGEKT